MLTVVLAMSVSLDQSHTESMCFSPSSTATNKSPGSPASPVYKQTSLYSYILYFFIIYIFIFLYYILYIFLYFLIFFKSRNIKKLSSSFDFQYFRPTCSYGGGGCWHGTGIPNSSKFKKM